MIIKQVGAYTAIKDFIVSAVKGSAKGSCRSLCNWATFAGNICTGDEVTFKNMSNNLSSLGHNLVAIARELNDSYSSFVTMGDPMASPEAFLKELDARKNASQERLNKMTNRAGAVLQAGQNAIVNMMQKSVEDNVAGITESITDAILIGGIAKSVGILAGAVGNKCINAAHGINITIPTNLLDATPKMINGQAVAVVGGTTINLGEAIAAGAEGLLDPLLDAGTLAAQGNNFFNKANNSNDGGNGSKQGGNKSKPVVEAPQRKESPVWDNTTKEFFDNIKKNSAKDARHNKYGNFYKDPKTDLWWAKDHGGHSGPHYKVFKETKQGFEWISDIDLLGKDMIDKHKGPTGRLIPRNEIIFKS